MNITSSKVGMIDGSQRQSVISDFAQGTGKLHLTVTHIGPLKPICIQ